MKRRRVQGSVAMLAALLGVAGCQSAGEHDERARAQTAPAPAGSTPTLCGTYSGRGCAPASRRVDLSRPSFSHPTNIDNPLNPIGKLRSALLLGHVEGLPLRVETTLLPGAKTITFNGRRVKALTSQYVAWLDGRIEEVALDWYAQDDDGAVWYLGEDVFNYARGAVADTEGTWLAGRDGPAAMIMPAQPGVGDVYRPENIPGIVFEEVTVKAVARTVEGPRGPVDGAIVVEELHLDGGREEKTFAPGYGEFHTGSPSELEALALAVPTDALDAPPPAELEQLTTSATGMLGSAQAEDWEAADATLERMRSAWAELRGEAPPPMLRRQMGDELERLGRAVAARRPVRTAHAALDTGLAALDLELRHRRPSEIDRARFDLWASRILVHAAAGDVAGVTGAVASLEWIRDRIAHTLAADERGALDAGLREMRAAATEANLRAAADRAARVAAVVRAAG